MDQSEDQVSLAKNAVVRYTIQVVAWNNGPQLVDCLRSVLASSHPSFEVLVLDNASPQDESAAVHENFSGDHRVRCEKSDTNLFFAGGHNHVSSQAQGEFLILLNPDTVVEPDWLEHLDALDASKPFEVGQLELLRIEPAGEPQTQGIFLDRTGFVKQVMAIDPRRVRKQILGANGAALILRRSLWESLGGFDERFAMYFEETDLCWRAARQGAVAEFFPGPIVRHIEGGSHGRSKKGFARSQYMFTRNRAWSLLKNLDVSELLWAFPLHLVLSMVVAVRFALVDGWGKGWAVIAGLGASLPGWLPALRARVKPKVSNAQLRKTGVLRHEVLGFKLPGC